MLSQFVGELLDGDRLLVRLSGDTQIYDPSTEFEE